MVVSSRSTSMRPSSASFANSQSTIAEIPHRLVRSKLRSAGFSAPISAKTRMWVSRLSIPAGASRQDVADDRQLPAQAADQLTRLRVDRYQLGDRFAALCD